MRVFFYLENRECQFDRPLDKLQFSMVQAFDEMEHARASQRATDKAVSQARAGHVTGGRVFGYDNVAIDGPHGQRSHVERRVNESEAVIVRRIFELAATGVGQGRIARLLNEEGVASPRAQRDRPRGWAVSSVHDVLFRLCQHGFIDQRYRHLHAVPADRAATGMVRRARVRERAAPAIAAAGAPGAHEEATIADAAPAEARQHVL